MKIMILGGDGFCGWPTSLYLASLGNEVMILDNLSRRAIDSELGTSPLLNIASAEERVATAKEYVGEIKFQHVNLATEYDKLKRTITDFEPETIVHFGEQRAAPYSMLGGKERCYTVDNNVSGTHNVCSAIVETDLNIHLVHLGTMGVYGYNSDFGEIPEGYLDITVNSTQKSTKIVFPQNPGSIYHMTKCLDHTMLQYYFKNWGMKVTDLHQGIVWGFDTQLTSLHPNLRNRFDYDGIYGTVLNRFIVQAMNNHPLTIYGSGGQTRAFINISDTAHCILLAIKNPPKSEVRILNQVSEVKTIIDLANMISKRFGAEIKMLENPRKELPENDLMVANEGLRSLGFDPILLENQLIDDVANLVDNADVNFSGQTVLNSPKW